MTARPEREGAGDLYYGPWTRVTGTEIITLAQKPRNEGLVVVVWREGKAIRERGDKIFGSDRHD